jgi:Ala-tRNA(Pro) deacylase
MHAKLKQLLDESRVSYSPIVHRIAYTAQEVAEAEHVPGREHAKVTVIRAGEGFLLAVLPATRKVDLAKLAHVVSAKPIRLADESEFSALFPDCEPGAMPPFGHLFGLPVIVDSELEKDEHIVFQAGSHAESVRMRYADFKRLGNPRVADIIAN